MAKKNWIFYILLLLAFPANAQQHNYNIYNYSTENGLPTNELQYVYQDSYGFLWLASYDGLFRWDGYSFKKYAHNERDSTSLDHNIVYSVFEDSQKQLWVGTIEGLNLYNRATDGFIHCNIRNEGDKIPVNAIAEDSHHQLWLGTSNGLCKYIPQKKQSQWFSNKTSDDVIFCLAADHADNIWAGTFSGGVKKFSQTTKTFQTFKHQKDAPTSPSSNKIRSILIDDEQQVWVGTTDKGIDVLNSNGTAISHYHNFLKENSNAENTINCLHQDKQHTIWIGVGRASVYYVDKNGVPTALTNGVQNSQNQFLSVSSICEDSFGNIWFATNGNGLFYTNQHKNVFGNYLKDPGAVAGLQTSVITCFYEDSKGFVWMGTDRGGMLKFDPVRQIFSAYNVANRKLTSDAINDIKGDKQGNLWIATWGGGVMQFDPVLGSVKTYLHDNSDDNSLPFNDAKTVLPDDSLVWIGTHGQGLTAFDRKRNLFINNKNTPAFPFQLSAPAWINYLFKDSKKRLWICTYSGLFVFDGKQLIHYEHAQNQSSISSNSVNMVAEDNTGKIWIISESGGLDQFDDVHHVFIRCTHSYNLSETMKGIVTDRDNRLWISSNEGISEFDLKSHQVKKYGVAEGLQGNTFFHKAVLKTQAGQLYFGGPRGFNVFSPDSLKAVRIPSYFYFTDLNIYNELQHPGMAGSPLKQVLAATGKLVLTHRQSFFSVEFASINLYSPAETQYAYQLQPLHNQWINLKTERKVSFTNLDPGTYFLKIRYTNINGEWQQAAKTLELVILPPWWETWWARLLAYAVLAGLAISLFYYRVASIKNRNKFLKAEVEKRTHELSELNSSLIERNDKIKIQKEILEDYNEELLRKSDKILDQQKHITLQNQKLELTVSELQKLNNAKDHFFSILAHDLKNPISAITGISAFMKNNFLKLGKTETQEHLDSIHKSSNAIYDLLVNLLNWSRTQSKKVECNPVEVNIGEIVQKNTSLLQQQLQNKHLELRTNINPAHRIFADYNMIDTVIRNLVSNSIKFTDYNGSIKVSSLEKGDNITICIADDGVGMPCELVKKLFNIDKSNIATGTAGEKGTGLGLVICHEFIKINKGAISVKSEPGKGSEFYISLPQSKLTPAKPKNGSLAPQPALDFWDAFPIDKLVKIKGRKILIVDDNRELRVYLKLLLSDTFEIFEAGDGQEGLNMALQIQPTAIISDLMMPVMNGAQLCKEIKGATATSHIPVILLTSQSEEDAQLSGYEAGADVYLTKPVKKELLIQVVLNFIQNQEKLRDRMRENVLDNNTLYPEDAAISKLDEDFLNRLVDFIERHVADPNIDAHVICDKMAVSRTVLYSKIKNLTGQSVHEFIKSIRLKKSLKLLIEGKLTVSQVAYEVGFSSHSYFDKCFVKQYGKGPKEYVRAR